MEIEMAEHDAEQAYHELCAYTLTRADPAFIHQHVVDAFAAQDANESTKPITLTFALIGLHLHVDRGFTGRQVQRAHQWLARERRASPAFAVPENRGAMTAADVMVQPAGAERDAAIHGWAASVWRAFADHDQQTVEAVRNLCASLPWLAPT
jgi:hypothetical protein